MTWRCLAGGEAQRQQEWSVQCEQQPADKSNTAGGLWRTPRRGSFSPFLPGGLGFRLLQLSYYSPPLIHTLATGQVGETHRYGQRGSERLSDLPRVTQLLAGWSCSFIHPSLTRCHGDCQQWEPDRQVTLSLAGQPDAGSFPHTGLHMGQPCPSALMVQWLRLCPPSARRPGFYPWSEN